MCLPESNRFVPACSRSIDNRLWHKPVGNLVGSDAVLVHDAKHRLTILRVSLECTYSLGDLRRSRITVPGHDGRDGSSPRTTLVGIVSQALSHQHGTKVRMALAELAKAKGPLVDLLGRVAGKTDGDLRSEEHDLDS